MTQEEIDKYKLSRRTPIIIDYTNHAGKRSKRKIIVHNIIFKATEWHPGPQWILAAYDVAKQAHREFAMKGIHEWGCEPEHDELDLAVEKMLKGLGYADGDYMVKCNACEHTFTGDKRASLCKSCALIGINEIGVRAKEMLDKEKQNNET